mmetsp:Transcript_80645/g.152353  ORF Transcript_80645/g.152353 Transcript_80645/m.152353 type:complete len:744 (-) Transcript_80645:112-2343(-)
MMMLPGWNTASKPATIRPPAAKPVPALVLPKNAQVGEQPIIIEAVPTQTQTPPPISPDESPLQKPAGNAFEQQGIMAVQKQISFLEGKLENALTHMALRLEEVAHLAEQSQTAGSVAAVANAAVADGHPPSLSSSSVAAASYSSLRSELKDLKKQFEALQQAIDGEVLEAFRRLRQQTTDLGEKFEKMTSETSKAGSERSNRAGSSTPTSAGPQTPETSRLQAKVSELAHQVAELQSRECQRSNRHNEHESNPNDGVKLSILSMAQRLDAVDAQLEELADRQGSDERHARSNSAQERLFQAVDERVAQMGKDLLRLVEERCATVDLQAHTFTVEQEHVCRGLQEKLGELSSRLSRVSASGLDPSDYFQSLEDRVGNLGSTIHELRGQLHDELYRGLREELVVEIGTEIRTELKTVEGKEAWLMAALNARDRSLQSASSEAHDAIVAAIQSATNSARNSGNQAGASPATSAFSPLAKLDRSSRSFDESFEAWDTLRREPTSPQAGSRVAPPPPGPPDAPSARSSNKSVASRTDSAPRRGRQQAGEPLQPDTDIQDLIVQVSPYRPQARALRSQAVRQGTPQYAGNAGAQSSSQPANTNGSVSSSAGRKLKEELAAAGADATPGKGPNDGEVRLDTRGQTPPPQKPGTLQGKRQSSGGPQTRPSVPQTPPHQSRSTISAPTRQAAMPSTPPTHERQTGGGSRNSRSPADARKGGPTEGPKKRFPGRLHQIEEKVNDEMSPNSTHG